MSLYILKHKKHLVDRLGFIHERHPLFIYLMSIIVGAISSFATIGFIKAYRLLTHVIYHTWTTNFATIAQTVPHWYFFVTFIAGGLIIGLFIYFFIPYHGHGHGLPHLLYCFRKQRYISVQEGFSSTLASSFSLGIGASVGRELPAIFFSSSVVSWFCQFFNFKGHYFRVFICAAIGTSLATSLHSTLVGLFFVIEIISFSLTSLDLLPIALAIFTGAVIREFFPDVLYPIYYNFEAHGSAFESINFIILGLFCGVSACIYMLFITKTIRFTFQNKKIPKWIWPAVGGVGLALISYVYPQALGIGFDSMFNLMENHLSLTLVLGIFIAKWITTSISVGFGFSGGVLTPTVFIGLLIGTLYYGVFSSAFPSHFSTSAIYAIGGAAAFTSVVVGAPITATFLVYEITKDVTLTLNIFMAIFIAQIFMKAFNISSLFETQYNFLYKNE